MSRSELISEIDRTIAVYEQVLGRRATRTHEMIENYGVIEAVSRLVVSADLQKGFRTLRDSGQLVDTFEALVVRFPEEFEEEVVESAAWRLENPHGLL